MVQEYHILRSPIIMKHLQFGITRGRSKQIMERRVDWKTYQVININTRIMGSSVYILLASAAKK